MATVAEIITRLRSQIGDTDPTSYHITDSEMTTILTNSSNEYSRIKSYIALDETQIYDQTKDPQIYSLPANVLKVKSIYLKIHKWPLSFIDNFDQVILTSILDVDPETMVITYSRYFDPTEIVDKEMDMYLIYAEALCYKLLSTKTVELIKFSTGEKHIDESTISAKYLKLYEATDKIFRSKMIKAYGRRAEYPKDNFDYVLPYPPEGEALR
jgi:hypothetical protein